MSLPFLMEIAEERAVARSKDGGWYHPSIRRMREEPLKAVVERLLAQDAIDVNQARTSDGITPLYIACQKNHEGGVGAAA